MRLEFDHLVVAARSLAEGEAHLWGLGLGLQAGGRHERMGTHNALMALEGGAYLELIAVDPDGVPPSRPRWFALDGFSDRPRLVHWVARVVEGDLEGVRLAVHGPAHPMARGAFSWQICIPDDGALPLGGVLPTLIQWDEASKHPSDVLIPSACRLHKLELCHPEVEALRSSLNALGLGGAAVLEAGPMPRLRAWLETPNGLRVLD